jgi:hypothetical protein
MYEPTRAREAHRFDPLSDQTKDPTDFNLLLLRQVCKRCSVRLYLQLFVVGLMSYLHYLCLLRIVVPWNLSNPTHQGTREMCRIVQDVGILNFIYVNRTTETINCCQMSQDVGKLRCWIAQVPLYNQHIFCCVFALIFFVLYSFSGLSIFDRSFDIL